MIQDRGESGVQDARLRATQLHRPSLLASLSRHLGCPEGLKSQRLSVHRPHQSLTSHLRVSSVSPFCTKENRSGKESNEIEERRQMGFQKCMNGKI